MPPGLSEEDLEANVVVVRRAERSSGSEAHRKPWPGRWAPP